MLKHLVFGASLSLVSLSAMALPEQVDVAGIELGASIEDVASKLKEQFPDSVVKEQDYPDGKGLGKFYIRDHETFESWTVYSVPDGSGRIARVTRLKRYDLTDNVGVQATRDALLNKYGHDGSYDRGAYYWAEKTDEAPAESKDVNPYDVWDGINQIFFGRFEPAVVKDIKYAVKADIETSYKHDGVVRDLTVDAIWVKPTVAATQKYIEKLKQEKEAEQQRQREEAANNAADI